ncbi:endonuclease/exonuclease/phosphatase family protein [Nocardiopsis potens]|uniref:endonuclease/exonuclease/phosphatase family protein n=1 Tax=Nocardiopsis potens TaxID=1246458 RepID=UPI000345DD4A|nr:endonuclease/exonuclease/phosphatase family protein [Nocardiopsis potens]
MGDRAAGPRARRRRWAAWAALALALPWALWAAVRCFGLEAGFPLIPLMSYTPYAAGTAVLPVVVAVLLRERWAGLLAAAAAVALAACVLPRIVGAAAPEGDGPRLRVLSVNSAFGQADADAVAALVRRYDVDVLGVQEATPQGVDALIRSGLRTAAPNLLSYAAPGPVGGALFSAHPLKRVEDDRVSGRFFAMPWAALEVPGAAPVEVAVPHPVPPVSADAIADWRASLAEVPPADPGGPARILAGDFNATLDHAELRSLLSTGYVDAAAEVGAGLEATWPAGGGLPGVAIDHVLADRRIGVREVTVHEVPGTDHRAVLAELVLPEA